jgi:RNA polymerase sigma factor (sigma-70 family)
MDADEAIADLLSRFGDRLLRLAFQLCHDRSASEDLVQQALEQVYRRWRARGVVEQPHAYARKAVLNEYLRRRRLASSHEVFSDSPHERADGAGSTEADVLVERDAMWQTLGRLPRRQRAALVLRYYEDVPDAEIAALLGCRPATVRSLVARGLTGLRGLVDEAAESRDGAR